MQGKYRGWYILCSSNFWLLINRSFFKEFVPYRDSSHLVDISARPLGGYVDRKTNDSQASLSPPIHRWQGTPAGSNRLCSRTASYCKIEQINEWINQWINVWMNWWMINKSHLTLQDICIKMNRHSGSIA